MAHGLEYGRYQQYLSCATDELGVPRARSVEDARAQWGVRDLPPAEFQLLMDVAAQDVGLRERWRERLEFGYHREKLELADEIEDLFAHLAVDEHVSSEREDAA